MFFVCFWHFAALYLRAASADRRETFKRDWKRVNLDNVGTKIGGRPQLSQLLKIVGGPPSYMCVVLAVLC